MENEIKRTNRIGIGSFSFIKGIAILVIVFGHIAREFDVNQLTWFRPLFVVLEFFKTPFIPVFFIISGYGFKMNSFPKILKRTIKTLIIPYIFVMLASCCMYPLITYIQTGNISLAIRSGIIWLFSFLLGLPKPGKVLFYHTFASCSSAWFLLALFWGQNILNWILKRKSSLRKQSIYVVGCGLLGYVLCVCDLTYFCIPQGMIAASYLYVGYLLKKYRLLEKKVNSPYVYVLWGIAAMIYAKYGYFDLCYGEFFCFIIDYVGVCILALLLIKVGIYIGNFNNLFLNLIKRIGLYSYWIICIHSVEQKCLPWKKFAVLTHSCPNLGFLVSLLIKALIIFSSCLAIKRVEKWKYGKTKKLYSKIG